MWSVSLTNHLVTPVLGGANLRWLDSMDFARGSPPEPTILYDNCGGCAADTYFTSFHYDLGTHAFAARWTRGGQGVPNWSANAPAGVAWTQVYAVMVESGHALLGTWSYFDYGKHKPPEEFIYRYDLDPSGSQERSQLLTGKNADAMKQRLCRAQDAVAGLARGQDSALCQQILKPRYERKPVTTPPADNRGQMARPGSRH